MSDFEEYEELFNDDLEGESENRSAALEDIRFARLGEQWPDEAKLAREREGRPCLTINRLPSFIRQVVNDSRLNKPQIKVKPVDDKADTETAEILSGLIRNIEYTSGADVAYDTALESAVTCGMGFFRIDTEYTSDDEFTQDICIKRVTNPLSVVFDTNSESLDGSDWTHAFLIDWITEDEYKRRFNKKECTSFASDAADGVSNKQNDDLVRIAKFYEVKETPSKLLLLNDGTVIKEADYTSVHPELGIPVKDFYSAMGVEVHQDRKVMERRVIQRILGGEVLEESDWAGKYIPIIPVFGEEVFYEGRRILKSLIRDAKDPQRMLNYWRTASTELVALAPKTPFIGPTGAFKTDAKKWATANLKSHAFIEYDGGIQPQRQPFAGPPAGALQEALNAADDIKSILGIYDASLGARSNETSGKAIMARQREGDVSTFHYIDNQAKSIAHSGRILVDLIPKIYDTPRIIRILGIDGTTQNVGVNQPTKHKGVQRVFDMKVGKYDVAVDTGPSFTTQREEAAAQMTELIRSFPQAAPIIGDLLAKNMDWPDADEIARRMKIMLPPQLQEKEGQPEIPPQVQAQMAQMKQAIEQMQQMIQKGGAELQKLKADKAIDMRKLEIDAYNAETNRLKVQVDLGDKVATHLLNPPQQPMNPNPPPFGGQDI